MRVQGNQSPYGIPGSWDLEESLTAFPALVNIIMPNSDDGNKNTLSRRGQRPFFSAPVRLAANNDGGGAAGASHGLFAYLRYEKRALVNVFLCLLIQRRWKKGLWSSGDVVNVLFPCFLGEWI